MKCPACGAVKLVHDTRDMPYTHKGEPTVIPAVGVGGHYPAYGESEIFGDGVNAFSRQENG